MSALVLCYVAAEPRTRPKLMLAPRTKPLENPPANQNEPSSPPPRPAPTTVPATSIFGSAKPVDTSARERQIEERLAKQTEKTSRDLSGDSRRDNRWDDDRGGRRRVSDF